MVSLRSRPICERSCAQALASDWNLTLGSSSHLYVVALVVVAAFAEKSVVNNAMDVELIKEGITILLSLAELPEQTMQPRTLETDAVKTTTSYSSPTRFMNWSTPGRLMT